MIQVVEGLSLDDGVLVGDIRPTDQWSAPPYPKEQWQLRFFLGDEVGGPVAWIMSGKNYEIPDGHFVHHHRSDSMRIGLGEHGPQVRYGNRWHGLGDFHVLTANSPYTAAFGPEEYCIILLFADRRGLPVITKKTAEASSDVLIAKSGRESAPFGDGLRVAFERDDDATSGVDMSFAPLPDGRRYTGSLFDTTGWTISADGSATSTVKLGDPESGPVVALSNNAPDTVEGSSRYDADSFRLVIRGTCTVGSTQLGPGQYMALDAGVDAGDVRHGAEGSTQVLFLADRRAARPQTSEVR